MRAGFQTRPSAVSMLADLDRADIPACCRWLGDCHA